MFKDKRRSQIITMIKEEKSISVADLSRRLGVSYMTVWRDLDTLEHEGLLRKTRGGAVITQAEAASPLPSIPRFMFNQDQTDQKKIQIGRYAASQLVMDGDNITVEAGTTVSRMVPFLNQSNLTVLTNGLISSVMAAPRIHEMTLICSGGVLIETGAFIGPQAEEFFNKFRVKKAFFGAQGLTLEDGFTDPTPLYIQLKCAMKQNAEQTIMLIDSSKLGVRSLIRVMLLEEVDIVVTDSEAPPEIIAGLRQKGIDVRIAE